MRCGRTWTSNIRSNHSTARRNPAPAVTNALITGEMIHQHPPYGGWRIYTGCTGRWVLSLSPRARPDHQRRLEEAAITAVHDLKPGRVGSDKHARWTRWLIAAMAATVLVYAIDIVFGVLPGGSSDLFQRFGSFAVAFGAAALCFSKGRERGRGALRVASARRGARALGHRRRLLRRLPVGRRPPSHALAGRWLLARLLPTGVRGPLQAPATACRRAPQGCLARCPGRRARCGRRGGGADPPDAARADRQHHGRDGDQPGVPARRPGPARTGRRRDHGDGLEGGRGMALDRLRLRPVHARRQPVSRGGRGRVVQRAASSTSAGLSPRWSWASPPCGRRCGCGPRRGRGRSSCRASSASPRSPCSWWITSCA